MSATATGTACRLCGASTAPAFVAADRNREVDDAEFAYRRCGACATVQLLDVPDDLGRYYAGDYHGVPSPEELRSRLPFEAHKVELLRRHVAPGRLTEVGPSFGAFALAAKEAGFDVTGVEMDEACCAFLEEHVGVRAVRSAEPEAVLASLPPSRAVAMWHVLEHVPRPVALIEAAAANLEPGGVLAVGVPNPESLQFRALRARWPHLDAPRHLSLIPYATLARIARAAGLEPAERTTDDPFGRHCNRWGWETALRRRPAAGPSSTLSQAAGLGLALALAPVERRGLNGAAYTAVFSKPA